VVIAAPQEILLTDTELPEATIDMEEVDKKIAQDPAMGGVEMAIVAATAVVVSLEGDADIMDHHLLVVVEVAVVIKEVVGMEEVRTFCLS
jgi:hypothetical protein